MTQKNNERLIDIRKMRESGSTLQEIGTKYGVSRERIRQICQLNSIAGYRVYKRVEIKCANKDCQKMIVKVPSSPSKYCCNDCRLKSVRINPLMAIKDYPEEERKKYERERMREWCHRNKNEDWYKASTREHNQRYYAKYKEQIQTKARAKYAENREELLKKNAEYQRIHREKINAYRRERYNKLFKKTNEHQ